MGQSTGFSRTGHEGGAAILPFVRRHAAAGLNVSERIEALRWADAARALGVRDLHIHEPEPGDDPGLGGFMLIYLHDNLWAAWGVAFSSGSYEVWRPSSGATVGWFGTLREALAAIRSVT